MFRIRKQFHFEGSHILSSAYSGACKNHIHGHSYIVEVFLQSENLNEDGMIVDFGKLRHDLKPILEEFDHKLIVHKTDYRDSYLQVADILFPTNPTAENMAYHIYCLLVENQPQVYKVRVHETATGWAEYEK